MTIQTVVLGALLTFAAHLSVTPTIAFPTEPLVQCFEDGSCTNGYCEPFAGCDDSREQ